MNILDWRGPDFLELYIELFLAALAAGFFLRWALRGTNEAQGAIRAVPAYEAAYLAGGNQSVLQSALATLTQRGQLSVNSDSRQIAPQQTPKADLRRSPVEAAVFAAFKGSPHTVAALKRRLDFPEIRQGLRRLGWVLTPGQLFKVQFVSSLPLLLLFILGLIKIGIGLDRERPVEFLILLSFVTLVVFILWLAKPPLRTRQGQKVLNDLRESSAALRTTARRSVAMLAPEDLGLAVGLFGLAALTDGPMTALAMALKPPPSANSGGCSSGGCGSGGGGCGGGGGGGCGGCGGG
jgi:uncharacterized protein (TIGR04222 family)